MTGGHKKADYTVKSLHSQTALAARPYSERGLGGRLRGLSERSKRVAKRPDFDWFEAVFTNFSRCARRPSAGSAARPALGAARSAA